MKTPVEVLLSVVRIDGKLDSAGDKLRVLLPVNCPPELKDAIRQHKLALLDLMRLTFLVVRSDALNSIVFFAPDDATKESLVAAGVDPGSIHTTAELGVLVQHRITMDELPLIHAAKQRFNAKVTNSMSATKPFLISVKICRLPRLHSNRSKPPCQGRNK
jgi:hypothetical protein